MTRLPPVSVLLATLLFTASGCGSDERREIRDADSAGAPGGDTFEASRLPSPATFEVSVGAKLPSCADQEDKSASDDGPCVPTRGCAKGWVLSLRVTGVTVSPYEDRYTNVIGDEATPEQREALQEDNDDGDFFVSVSVEQDDGYGARSFVHCLDNWP